MAIKRPLKEKRYCSNCKKAVKVTPTGFGEHSPKCPFCRKTLLNVKYLNFVVAGSTGAYENPRKYKKETPDDDS